jgi:hypothetical protein
MPGFMLGIHVFLFCKQDVDGRDIGERSDAVLRTAMPGHDDFGFNADGKRSNSKRFRQEVLDSGLRGNERDAWIAQPIGTCLTCRGGRPS